ncbi:nephrin-like [Amphiura filiformis]|uniref:nephrin-like n=1 Tax=Amphiura filiformis TaxID=82378 RepID=UPI003B211A7B
MCSKFGPPEEPTLTGNINDMTEGVAERLECEALNGFPTGDLRWYINDQEITEKDVFNTPNTYGRFDITSNITFNPTKDHNGIRLKCDVLHETLQSGEERSVVQIINVKYSPRDVFINQSPPNPVVENTLVTLRCTADANPVPDHFIWLKGEVEVGNNANVLKFPNINRNDEGQYKCKATNGIGSEGVSPVVMVTVHFVEFRSPENVILTKSIGDPVQEGERLELSCTSGGKPSPNTFYWFQDDMPLPNTNSSQLLLESINKEQAGIYKCEAENGVLENVQSNEVDVIVYYSPEITTEKTIDSIDEGKDASLECIGIGHPEPTLKWYTSEGIPINSGGKISIIETTLGSGQINGTLKMSLLNIRQVSRDDYGVYVCNASNGIGYDVHRINLTGLAKPFPPNDVRIVTGESETTALTVRWTSGHNGGVNQWFIIKYYKDEENEEELYSGTVKETSDVDYKYQINGLTSGIAYYIRVISGNMIGNNTSQESPRARGITLPVSPQELGVTMEYVQKAQTLSVGNLPEYSDESHCLQLQLHNGDKIWYNWMCVFENQDELNVPDGVVEVQATYCVESVCGDASKAKKIVPGDSPSNQTGLIIGSSVAGATLVLVIVALSVYLLRTSKTKTGGNTGKGSLELTSSNGANVGVSNPGITTGDAPLYAQVNKDQKKTVPLYAQVNKDQKKNVPVYAQVNKDQKKNDEDAYDDVENYKNQTNAREQGKKNESDGRTVSPEGLIYQTVEHIKSHPKDAPPIQTEESTDYAELNFKLMKDVKK